MTHKKKKKEKKKTTILSLFKNCEKEEFSGGQWLGLSVLSAGVLGSIPNWRTWEKVMLILRNFLLFV